MPRKCYWYRYIYNGYEPDNVITFFGVECTEKPGTFYAEELSFYGSFNDGAMYCRITCVDGVYRATVDDKEYVCDSFEDAWEKLPSFLTSPDHLEQSEITIYE